MVFKRLLAISTAVAAAWAAPAAAAVKLTSETGNPGWLTATIAYSPGGIGAPGGPRSASVYAGRSHFGGTDLTTLNSVTFDAYCIDIFHWINTNGSTWDIGTLATLPAAKKLAVTRLLLSTANAISSQGTLLAKQRVSAGIQLALWEIMSESSSNSWSLSSGLFTVSGGSVMNGASASAFSLGQGYLNGLANAAPVSGLRVLTLDPISPVANQRQVFLAAVPEPSAWAMLIMGFGVIGGAMRTRRRTRIATA